MTAPPSVVANWNEIDGNPQPPDYTQGPQGPPGPAGPAGPIGPPGEDGDEGIQGDAGDTGPGWKVMQRAPNEGEVTGDTLGTIWYDSITGQFWTLTDNTSPTWTWRFDGTVVGAQGLTGPEGPQGIQGPQGQTGPTGPQGEQGIQGLPGPQGIQGPGGPQGPQGNTGATGAPGAAGAPGADGADGAPGPVGPSSSVHEEFLPSNGATTITLGQPPNWILMLSRGGVVQSAADGHYTLAGSVITLSSAANGTERVVVDYAATGYTPVPPLSGAGLADGTVTSAKIQDGTIATADLADRSVTNAKLSADTARANLLTNGGFEIWQRGNGPFTTNGIYTADRWMGWLVGTDTLSVSKDATNVDFGSNNAAAATFVLGTGAGATGLRQELKKTDVCQLQGRTITGSVRVRTATANAVRLRLSSDGTGGTAVLSSFHTGDGTWQSLTATLTVPSDATLVVVMVTCAASCTAYIDNAMLVVGSVPADYAPLHPADELARCLRYFEQLVNANGVGLLNAFAFNTTTAAWIWPYRAPKAVTPTVTYSAAATFGLLNAGATALTATSHGSASVQAGLTQGQTTVASGLVGGNASLLVAATGQTAVMIAEANP